MFLLRTSYWLLMVAMPITFLAGQPLPVRIAIEDLPRLLIERGAVGTKLMKQFEADSARFSADLQRTNPAFGLVTESSGNVTETILTLNKTIESPWLYGLRKRRAYAQLNVAALETWGSQQRLMRDIKAEYVTLRLQEDRIIQLAVIDSLFERLTVIVQKQNAHGSISDLQLNLLHMGLAPLQARILEYRSAYHFLRGTWLSKLGLPDAENIVLTTDISFQAYNIQNILADDNIDNLPDLRPMQGKLNALELTLRMEKARRFSNLTFFGGAKSVTGNDPGMVLGIAIPLPLPGTNRKAIRAAELAYNHMENELLLQRNLLVSLIEGRLNRIWQLREWLAQSTPPDDDQPPLAALISSYEEGWTTLPELIASLQIYVDASMTYDHQLIEYYATLFELEAMLGRPIVTFASSVGDPQ